MSIPCPNCGTVNYFENPQPGRLLPCSRCNKFFLCPDPGAPPRPPTGRSGVMRQAPPQEQATVALQAPGSGGFQPASVPRSGPNSNAVADLQRQIYEVQQLVQSGRGQLQVELDALRRDNEELRKLVATLQSGKSTGGGQAIEELEEAHQQLADQLQATREQQDELFRLVRGMNETPRESAGVQGLQEFRSQQEAMIKQLQEELDRLKQENVKLNKQMDERTQDLSEVWQQNEQTKELAQELELTVKELLVWKNNPVPPPEPPKLKALNGEVSALRQILEVRTRETHELIERLEQLEKRLNVHEEGSRKMLSLRDTAEMPRLPKTVPVTPPPPPPPAPEPAPITVPVATQTDTAPITKQTKPLPESPSLSKQPSVIEWLQGLSPTKPGNEKVRDQLFQLEALHSELEALRKRLEEKDRTIAKVLAQSLTFQGAAPDSTGAREATRLRDQLKAMEVEREQMREHAANLEAQFIELSEEALKKKLAGETGPDPSTNWQHGIHFQLLVDDEAASEPKK